MSSNYLSFFFRSFFCCSFNFTVFSVINCDFVFLICKRQQQQQTFLESFSVYIYLYCASYDGFFLPISVDFNNSFCVLSFLFSFRLYKKTNTAAMKIFICVCVFMFKVWFPLFCLLLYNERVKGGVNLEVNIIEQLSHVVYSLFT